MARSVYTQRMDDEPFEASLREATWLACCDCGLVHEFRFRLKGATKLTIRVRRNARATAGLRRGMRGRK